MFPYTISFKIQPCEGLPHGLSDTLGINFKTVEEAERYIARMLQEKDSSLIDEMYLDSTSMWVTDKDGNFC